jgi:hypothetical protein
MIELTNDCEVKMLDLNKIYSSNNYGDFKIHKYIASYNVIIEFIDTGYRRKVEASDVRKGNVRDHLKPVVFGVGFYGDGSYKSSNGKKTSKAYQDWYNMLMRCYCPKELKRKPAYKNTTVCDEWHNFQNFAKWHEANYKQGLQLDKDIKQAGFKNKVYSPETCIFVSHSKNAAFAQAKHYKMRDPNGNVVEIYDMKKFCDGKGLSNKGMSAVHNGKRNKYKGWTKA